MWTKIKAQPKYHLEEQSILRWCNAPVACVKRRSGHWACSLLCVGGISTVPLELPLSMTLQQVMSLCEEQLRIMGWQPEVKVEKTS